MSLIKKSKLVCVKNTDLFVRLNKCMKRMFKYNAIIIFFSNNCKVPDEEMSKCFAKYRLNNNIKKYTRQVIYDWKIYSHICILVVDDFVYHTLRRFKKTDV